ncbi:hypothetical protein JCM19238_1154 [Vibrio ponticus]|nr:hypothetical protein JCM19238_1154 [Vibrio ponticus]
MKNVFQQIMNNLRPKWVIAAFKTSKLNYQFTQSVVNT